MAIITIINSHTYLLQAEENMCNKTKLHQNKGIGFTYECSIKNFPDANSNGHRDHNHRNIPG